MKRLMTVGLVVLLAPMAFGANPFVGKWKIDASKSHLTGIRDSVTSAGPNTWKFQVFAYSWTVKADGSQQPTPFGSTTALTIVSPTVWQFANKSQDKSIGSETWELAGDGQTMTRTFRGQKETGEPFSSVATMKRIGRGSGFAGTWESTQLQMTFTEVDITPNGPHGVTVNVPEDGTHYSLQFDGKDVPEESPRLPSGVTVSARMAGARTVHATTKVNGKVFDHETWVVSPDGKTFTYTQRDPNGGPPAIIVLHRMGD